MFQELPIVLSGLSIVVSFLILAKVLRIRSPNELSPTIQDIHNVADVVRQETDRARSDAEERARGLRIEVNDNIRGFQEFTLKAFQQLGDQIGVQISDFSRKLDEGMSGNQERINNIGSKLEDVTTRMGQEASEGRERLRGLIEQKLEIFGRQSSETSQALRDELAQNFRFLGSNISETLQQLGAQQKERLERVATELAGLTEKQVQAQETLRTAVESRLDSIRAESSTKLDEIRNTVDEKLQTTLEKRLGESFRTVSEQLERVYQGLGEMQNLAAGVGDLKKVLSNVKTRGIWGEVQLGAVLEQFLSPEQYLTNAQVKDNSGERVEFAIRLPEALLPIDAKFPQDDYERLVHAAEAADPTAVEEAVESLLARVRQCAKVISEKYINPPKTTDFALLFLPTEGLYAEVLRQPGFCDMLQREYRVTVVGPTTLTALLNALQMGFRTLAIEKRSSEVWQVLGSVRTEFSKYGDVVRVLKKQLETATNTVDKLGTRTRVMNRTLQGVEMLPDASSQAIFALPASLTAEPDESTEEHELQS